ncbi:MAG: hypothetical protein LBK58_08685 [Prevotellaceae bacterium]|jgi:superfamily II DNA or RNA helicase|nr:hypothetical protein [Prevotellaceae bacterium]
MDEYRKLLAGKIRRHAESGFDVSPDSLNPVLFDFQKHCVQRMLKLGRGAIFSGCGSGKTNMQLEWARQTVYHTGKRVLILAPLSVSKQTVGEGEKFGYEVTEAGETAKNRSGLFITNYEQLGHVDPADYSGVVLDESGILKNFTGKYKNLLIKMFKDTPYRLCCTATPAPNDLNEIGNHSEFLGILDSRDMRSKWFVREEGMNNYRLKSHAKQDFYGWIASWAIMFSNPADIGFEKTGKNYILPPLEITELRTATEAQPGLLFPRGAVNATGFNAELRKTRVERLELAAKTANSAEGQVIIWIAQNGEGDMLRRLLPEAKEVKGSDPVETKEAVLSDFAGGKFKILISKTSICGFGMNFQNCGTQIFASPDFSFEKFYQAVRRSHRFGRKETVNIYLIIADTMENVKLTVERKQKTFDEMTGEMNLNVNVSRYGLLSDYEYGEYRTADMLLMKGDACIEIKRIPDGSVDLIIFSPPFSSLFTYSNYIHDMGNNESHEAFFEQYAFLLKELYRILRPGRLMCCHTKDLGVYKNSSGYTGMYDFTGEHTKAVLAENFKLHSKVTVWTDPVLEMQRTKTQRLLYKTATSDSSYAGTGMAEYVTVFRKWEGDEAEWQPVNHINKQNFPIEVWQKWASPVWMDIRRTDVLNGREGTDTGDEKHIAPLQLEVIHRLVNLWSNPGETVFTPFLGIGSEAYQALKDGRKAAGCELKDSYFKVAVRNCQKAVESKNQMELFAGDY